MPGSLLGTEVRRVEDPELMRGDSRFVANLDVADDVLHLQLVRSPMAHALIRGVEADAARKAPGVVAVYTADELSLTPYHVSAVVNKACARPPLAAGTVRFVGDIVAVVAAQTRAQAVDAAELVEVDYEPLPTAVGPEQALSPGAPALFESLGTNLVAGFRSGGPAAGEDDPLADAEVVVRARIENQRLAVVPLEGHAIAVVPAAEPALTVYVSSQAPHVWRRLTANLTGLPEESIRVIAPHVGGGFGAKGGVHAEHLIAVGVARALNRAVTWADTRSENLVGMGHARAQVHYAELGLRRDGTITGLRARVIGDAGAYAGPAGALVTGPTYAMAQGTYLIPRIGYDVAVAVTTTTPVGSLRGAGRPEAAAMLERLLDLAARELGLDPVEMRRRNFIPPDRFPFRGVTGVLYDSGDYAAPLERALELADYPGLRAEQARRLAAGARTVLGIGIASYVEVTAGASTQEWAGVRVHGDGTATVSVGTSGHGQGHATSFAMLVSDRLGIPMGSITFVQSDTAVVPRGGGTGGSRSLQLGGSAVYAAAGTVLRQARELAAELLEARTDDIEVVAAAGHDGDAAAGLGVAGFGVAGFGGARGEAGLGVAGVPDRTISWSRLAAAARDRGTELGAELDLTQQGSTFPFGCHLSVVEVDLDTGYVRPVQHIAVDDCGRVLNPLLVRGQQHGGIAQGIGQALWEQVRFDTDGNPTTATLADYTIAATADLPSFVTANTVTPTPYNELGAKGIGESASVGSTPAVQNAVVDALAHLGVRHVDLPCTPERVWRVITDAEAGVLTDPWREPPDVFATLPVRRRKSAAERQGR